MSQRALLLVGLVGSLGSCSFDGSPGSEPDAAPVDSSIDGPPDRPIAQCLGTYEVVAGAPAGSRYRKLAVAKSVADHTAACAADNAHLVVLDSDLETTAMEAFATKRNGFFWVGLKDELAEGVWVTAKGVPATYLPWAKEKPNGGLISNCALQAGNQLFDFDCGGSYPAVCECD